MGTGKNFILFQDKKPKTKQHFCMTDTQLGIVLKINPLEEQRHFSKLFEKL